MINFKRKTTLWVSILIMTLFGIILSRSFLSYRYKNVAYEMRFYQHVPASEMPLKEYYDSLGYFPRSVEDAVDLIDKINNDYNFIDTKENIRARMSLDDLFSRNDGEIAYIPLYDYETKIPTSFIFLSAGIDGKMDNRISSSDTLYTNTWWHYLDVYNYGEAILVQDHWKKVDENWSLFDEYTYMKFYPPYPDLEPRFSMIKYLFGKKDWIIQIGLINN